MYSKLSTELAGSDMALVIERITESGRLSSWSSTSHLHMLNVLEEDCIHISLCRTTRAVAKDFLQHEVAIFIEDSME